jgi:phage protein D
MLTPAYKLTIRPGAGDSSGALGALTSALPGGGGGKVIDTTDEPKASTLVDLLVTLDMDAAADSFTFTMGQVGTFRIQRDADVTIELGYADDDNGLTQVMIGAVMTAQPGLTTARIVGHSAMRKLLRTFVDQTYESKTAGAIVSDLADQASVDVEQADEGINFPAYVIDGRRSAYQHMRDLAELCGFDLYINADGKLVFEKFNGGKTVHVFEFTKHIVELDVQHSPPRAGRVEAWGESPTGSQGEDAWAWLTKDFSGTKGSEGAGDPVLLLERPALRTATAARTAARAAQTAIQRRTLRGRLVSFGRPEVKLGDAIRLAQLPDDSLNASYQVRSVTHRITKRDGFATTIGFRSIES